MKQAKSTIMKAIIYAGIGLFSAATVYGITDYYSSNKKGTLEKMYAEEKAIPPAAREINEAKTTEMPVKITETVLRENEPTGVTVKSTKKVKRTTRKINFKEFSRARIPEPIETEAVKEVPVKKIEEKKQ